MRPQVGIGGGGNGDSYQSMTGKPYPVKNPPALGVVMPNRQTGIGMAPGTFQPQTGGGSPYEPGGFEAPMPVGGGGFRELNPGYFPQRPRGGFGRSPGFGGSFGGGFGGGFGRSPSPWGGSRFAPGAQFGDFDMSSIFRGIGDPYGGSDYGYGSGPETDFEMPWEQEPEPTGPGPGGPAPVDHGTHQQQQGGPDVGQVGGGGMDGGRFGDWAGRMGEMMSDMWSGAYQGDSAYGGGPGTGPSPNAPEPAEGAYSGGREGDYARGGQVRRFEGGGGADTAGMDDIRGQGRDQAVDPSWGDFSGDWGKVIDMATVGPGRGFMEVTGLADKIRDGIGWGGGEMGPQIAGGGDYSGPEMNAGDRGAQMRTGGPIRRNMGGIGYAVGGEGDGRSDEIPALLSNGEHVIPADAVSAFGRGSTDAGHKALNDLILKTRAKYRKSLAKLPPPKG